MTSTETPEQTADISNILQPFSLEKSNVRGRMVKLDHVLKDILEKHKYPPAVSTLLAELASLTVLLSAMIKYEGLFTLQVKGNGPLRTMVVDVLSDGAVRAYAGFDEDAVKKAVKRADNDDHNFFHLFGEGYMAFTVDQPGETETYQGIVQLTGGSLVKSVEHYFEQSEQIRTAFHLTVHPQDGIWQSGGIMLQHIPSPDYEQDKEKEKEDWTRAKVFLETCRDDELLSPHISVTDLLYRLFNEDGVRVYPAKELFHSCRCSLARVTNALMTLPLTEILEIKEEEGDFNMKCEFCGHKYHMTEPQLDQIIERKERQMQQSKESNAEDQPE